MQAESLVKVRQAITELVASGILSAPAGEQVQTTLLQLLNECERRKQKAQAAINALNQQVSIAQGEMNAWSSVSSVVQGLLNGHLERARAAAAEEAKRKAEEAQNASDREIAIQMQKAKEGLLPTPPEPAEFAALNVIDADPSKNGDATKRKRKPKR